MATNLQYRPPCRGIYQALNESPLHFVGDEYADARIVFEVREADGRDSATCEKLCREYIAAHSRHDVGMTAEEHVVALAQQFRTAPSKKLFRALRSAARAADSSFVGAMDSVCAHGYTESTKGLISKYRLPPALDIEPRSCRLYRLTPAYKAMPDLFAELVAV